MYSSSYFYGKIFTNAFRGLKTNLNEKRNSFDHATSSSVAENLAHVFKFYSLQIEMQKTRNFETGEKIREFWGKNWEIWGH